jgi:hypothetical protein
MEGEENYEPPAQAPSWMGTIPDKLVADDRDVFVRPPNKMESQRTYRMALS